MNILCIHFFLELFYRNYHDRPKIHLHFEVSVIKLQFVNTEKPHPCLNFPKTLI